MAQVKPFTAGWRHGPTLALTVLMAALLIVAAIPAAHVVSGLLYHPLGDYPVPQEIVPLPGQYVGENGPRVVQGGTIRVKGTKCNSFDYPVPVSGFTSLVRLAPTRALTSYAVGSGYRQPGCVTAIYENKLPVTLEPGVWQLSGEECTREANRPERCKVWYTSTFEVILAE